MTTKPTRVDDLGRAYAGSQLQIQIYVNQRSEELSQEVIQGLPEWKGTSVNKQIKRVSSEKGSARIKDSKLSLIDLML